jgi:hypothetical protein
MQDVAQLLILAALKLKENKPMAAAQLMGDASQLPGFELKAKKILRLVSSAESVEQVKEEPSVALVDMTNRTKDFSSYKSKPVLLNQYDRVLEEDQEGIADPYSLRASDSSRANYEEGEEEASEAEDEHDVDEDDQEPYAVGGDTEMVEDAPVESVRASFAIELMKITAAARRKTALRKKRMSDSARTGKKIKLTPRDA